MVAKKGDPLREDDLRVFIKHASSDLVALDVVMDNVGKLGGNLSAAPVTLYNMSERAYKDLRKAHETLTKAIKKAKAYQAPPSTVRSRKIPGIPFRLNG